MTRRRWLALAAGLTLLTTGAVTSEAHNNPTFVEVLLRSVSLTAQGDTRRSEPFTLELPKGSTELIWKAAGADAEAVRFDLSVDGEVVAQDLTSGTRSKLFRDKTFAVVGVTGGGNDVAIEVYSSVLDRSAPPRS